MSGRTTHPTLAELYRWIDSAKPGSSKTIDVPPGENRDVWQNRVTSRQQTKRRREGRAVHVRTWRGTGDQDLIVYIDKL